MASKCMLTTFDNPYNPFDEFTSWFMFDEEKGCLLYTSPSPRD